MNNDTRQELINLYENTKLSHMRFVEWTQAMLKHISQPESPLKDRVDDIFMLRSIEERMRDMARESEKLKRLLELVVGREILLQQAKNLNEDPNNIDLKIHGTLANGFLYVDSSPVLPNKKTPEWVELMKLLTGKLREESIRLELLDFNWKGLQDYFTSLLQADASEIPHDLNPKLFGIRVGVKTPVCHVRRK